MGFAQGVSALSASAANLDVIGNNIANSGTIGFKSGSVQFADVYAGSRVGLGTQVAGVAQNFTSGAVQSSTRALDVAITNGDGFFRLASPGGEIAYSRNGQFNVDKNGFLVNAAGLQLTGFPVSATGAIAGGSPTALQFPTSGMAPKPTDAIAAQFNLDSRSKLLPTTGPAFDAKDPATYSYSNAVNIFDSLGNSHELATFFRKTATTLAPASSEWEMYATADGQPLAAGGAIDTGTPPVAGTIGTVPFDSNGILDTAAATYPAGGKLNFSGLDFSNGSSSMTFDMNITGTTQFGNENQVNKLTQTGYTSGVLTSYAIGQDGTVTGKYSNEQSNPLGQIVLSSFINPNGLQLKGDNVWAETSASGQPLTGKPGSGTKLGALTAGALEGSNVDLTSELVNLIIAQRTYQANSQTVKTQDQVMQTLINMR
ncbi:MAG: flagellar hook protein FlgE [Polaromonas sp.]|nr:flagellar hook protein FlgE [Polaromonas sp.]